ncbi:hypothetical protein [Nocardia sp. NPDC024068]|uniref:hypothetical protein n=1 Tax=Nocardia sp. NPDC024068 TaxID=3157197 RepID=UPI0033F41EA2
MDLRRHPLHERGARPASAPEWDPMRWYPDTIVRRAKSWATERPWRRRLLWALLIVVVWVVFPGVVGAVAMAQGGSGVSQIDGLSWMNIRDSHGVPLASYMYSTNQGGILNPTYAMLWFLISAMFVGYITFVGAGCWGIDFALDFRWLDMFAAALTGVAEALVRVVGTPMVLITAASFGAFIVAWFVARGLPAKAAIQVVVMLGVAVIGPTILADPLGDVLSSDGILAQGRDVGLSVAAGLTGEGTPDPDRLVTEIQHTLADNFARRPVQVWNFGQVVDNYPACESAWTSAVLSGDPDSVREGMRDCGNESAYAKADTPTMGQVGTGLILLFCALVLLVFAAYFAFQVTKSALNSIYHAFMAIFGFAAGGFIYGPTQTFLVRNIVDCLVAAARMTAFTIFLGVYILFLKNLFDQANGQVISVLVIVCVVEIVAVSQIKRLNKSLNNGNDWIANRVSLAIQGGGSSGGGSGGGTALGMGGQGSGAGTGTGSVGSHMLSYMAGLSTINNSPLTGWLLSATPNPLNPMARGKKRSDLANARTADSRVQGYHWNQLARSNWVDKALKRSANHGGMTAATGVANALDGLGDNRVPENYLVATLRAAGAPDERVHQAMRAASAMKGSMSKNPYGWEPLQKAIAASRAVENHLLPTDSDSTRMAFSAQAAVAAENYWRHTIAPAPGAPVNHGFIATVRQVWDSDTALRNTVTPSQWHEAGRDTRRTIHSEVATEFRNAAHAYDANPTAVNREALRRWSNRMSNLAQLDPRSGLTR